MSVNNLTCILIRSYEGSSSGSEYMYVIIALLITLQSRATNPLVSWAFALLVQIRSIHLYILLHGH